MKTRTLLITVVLLTMVTVVIAGGTKKEMSVDEAMETFCYTWVNPDNSPEFEKKVVNPDELIIYYQTVDSPIDSPAFTGRFTLNDAWTDRNGDVWFKTTEKQMDGTYNMLNKISNSGSVLEYVWSYGDLPEDIDPESPKYLIWYRQG